MMIIVVYHKKLELTD